MVPHPTSAPEEVTVQAALQALQSPRRRAILRLVWDAERPAGEIAEHFEVSWPAISQHLRVLREAGLVHQRRDGPRRLYTADRAALGPLVAVLERMWADDLGRLKALAEAEAAAATTHEDHP